MLISVSGASSTGKSTLIKLLKKRLKEEIQGGRLYDKLSINKSRITNVVFIKEYIREYAEFYNIDIKKTFIVPEDAVNFQFNLFKYLKNEYRVVMTESETLYICDRCPFDSIIYLTINYWRLSDDLKIKYSREYIKYIHKSMELTNQSVDKIFLTMTDNLNSSEIEDDGVRPDIYKSTRNFEIGLFKHLCRGLNFFYLPNDTEHRIDCILDYLKDTTSISKDVKIN